MTPRELVVEVVRLRRGPDLLALPSYMTNGSAGMDLLADIGAGRAYAAHFPPTLEAPASNVPPALRNPPATSKGGCALCSCASAPKLTALTSPHPRESALVLSR